MAERKRITAGLAAGFLCLASTALQAQGLSLDAVNGADLSAKAVKGVSPAILRAQVLLDRARFSPGVIDGRRGENVGLAVRAFERQHGLKEDGEIDPEVLARLAEADARPALKEYTITDADLKGPFTKEIPERFEDKAELDRLGYTSPEEMLAERFHMDEDLLEALNPGKSFDKAGTRILVADVETPKPEAKVRRIEVDRSAKALRAFAEDGSLVAYYPATIGSEDKPTPEGVHEVTAVAPNPTYTYRPDKYQFKGVEAKKAFTIKAGPNNPVGSVWIDLSKDTYGIHGTPDPAKVGKTASHGCVRLTNWDAEELAGMVEKGVKVEFTGATKPGAELKP
ncbi:L,D-transpeptidase family protein [Salinarimonas soli]|uniref:Murein L,D-transpeptidase n=1 Tax=Salinarimonas soli TaxID=1638099 RepID=A0A5B2V8F5_9HYPH|nr:L,D-transpeptidase [Salinarimonas soli]KAA2235773.1 murein L,D-transpeptidase [Salinarimonas soli]